MKVFDEDKLSADDLIGGASFSLLPVFKKGTIDTWVTIKTVGSWGKVAHTGEIHLVIDFRGPPGVPFPQLQPDMDSFDDSQRIDRHEAEKARLEEEKAEEAAAEAKRMGRTDKSASKNTSEFSDKEIEDAFRFIDLDKNNHIGAAEIRHILVCMGELITDEEVDEMVRMCDTDGDGQISYTEFYASSPPRSRSTISTLRAKSRMAGEVSRRLNCRNASRIG